MLRKTISHKIAVRNYAFAQTHNHANAIFERLNVAGTVKSPIGARCAKKIGAGRIIISEVRRMRPS